MSNIRAMRKQVERMIQEAQPVKAKDLIVFVGSKEVIVNGEWLTYQEFKKRYSKYISDDWEVNIIGWNKHVKFPSHWHVIVFLDDTMVEG
ncbi:hypothetical protein [Vagococcus fluvialis]|uniref:hypothetical protein n=1 Tax=Vagococcus fluvialis TaxID=2738 RepID=UPI002B316117|nr:hypothetical protein QDW48_11890 [Vagococcus fluvialis]